MAFFEWKDNLTLGIPAVDSDHKMLIECVNELHDAMMAGKEKDVLASMLDNFIALSVEHFGHEETVWQSERYLDLKKHKEEHAGLHRTVDEFKANYDAGRIAFSLDVMNALRDWVRNHILVSDKEAAEAIKAAPATHPAGGASS